MTESNGLVQITRAHVVSDLRHASAWEQLLAGEADAIHIRAFASATECSELVSFIINHNRTIRYTTAEGVLRLGSSFSDIRKSGDIAGEYARPDVLQDALAVNGLVARLLGTIAA